MKRSTEGLQIFGKFKSLVQQIGKDNFCDRANGILKRFIENDALYQDCMAAYYINHHPNGKQFVQSLYVEACRLKQQVENLKLSLSEEKDFETLNHTERFIGNLENKIVENLREYAKFSTLLGNQYCANPGNIDPDIKEKVGRQLQRLPVRQPLSDSEILYAYYHYAGATSNRTVGGTLATSIATYFIDKAPKDQYVIPLKLAEIFIIINRAAGNREKFLRTKDTIVDMDQARAIYKELDAELPKDNKNKFREKLNKMHKGLQGSSMPDEVRQLCLEMYLEDFNMYLDNAMIDMQKEMAIAASAHPECAEELGQMSAELNSIFADIESERHAIEQFLSNQPK